jgi:hypothetical protein
MRKVHRPQFEDPRELGRLLEITPDVLRLRQLQLMAIDAGMEEVSLACLKRFADLVRADARAEWNAIEA